jgi:hypothetical protein
MVSSAGPQALGYLHQARYALYALLSQTKAEAAVILEGLDDLVIQEGDDPLQLKQLKHHLKREATLTDASTDLWKTLRIWVSQFKDGAWDVESVKLCLVTTATAPTGSAASYLRGGKDRDVGEARELLLRAIDSSRAENKTMLKAFNLFKGISDSEQMKILKAVTVVDLSATILEVQTLIEERLKFAAPPGEILLSRVCEQVEGWWFVKVVEHLAKKSQEPIALSDLHRKVWSITRQLKDDNLPIDYADAVPDYVVDPENDSRVFVQQLRILDIDLRRIKAAILDYYRAFEQRASWVRNQLLIDDDVERYDGRLVDGWKRKMLILEDEKLSSEPVEEEYVEIGRQLLKWVETNASFRIRPNVEDRFVLTGSYHILADGDKPRVWWHPNFVSRFQTTMSTVIIEAHLVR